jgi:hypothetical protein
MTFVTQFTISDETTRRDDSRIFDHALRKVEAKTGLTFDEDTPVVIVHVDPEPYPEDLGPRMVRVQVFTGFTRDAPARKILWGLVKKQARYWWPA